MSNRVRVLTAAAGLLLPLAGFATPLSYNYVELNYIAPGFDSGGFDLDGDGFQLNGSVSFADNFYFTARYADGSVDGSGLDLDFTRISAGVGYDTKIAESTSVYGQVTYESIDVDVADDSGWGLEGGLRYALSPQLEINGGIIYQDVGDVIDGKVGGRIGGFYDFTPNFAVVAGYENIDDFDQWNLGLRWTFAP
jgi:hypothetical protein